MLHTLGTITRAIVAIAFLLASGNAQIPKATDLKARIDALAQTLLARNIAGVSIAVDPTLSGPEGSAPSPNPVRFGSSQIASFSPAGSCTAGTLFIRSQKGIQYAVRVGNVSGRTRILRYDTGTRRWIDG